MWEELSNSKMFWLIAAAVSGIVLGSALRRLSGSKRTLGAVSTPFIGLILSFLYLRFVKLNVAYFDIKYTLIGIGGILILSLVLGYILWKSAGEKTPFWSNWSMFYALLTIIVFYIFYKDEQPIDTKYANQEKNIWLLLKKQDAGYFEINENGIGYTGITGYINGFRPRFTGRKNADELYSHKPVAVDIPTSKGIAHALLFKRINGDEALPDLDSLFNSGNVKPSELIFGEVQNR
jgi:hypothetical protein